jgi:hypothetical protein
MPDIIYRKTVELDPLYQNPRYIKDAEFESLCRSLRDNPEYFEARPIILSNRTGLLVIIAGNMRHKAAIHNGQAEVPTILLEGLTEEKEREIIIRDNVNNGSWDYDILANEWDKDQLIEWGVPGVWDLGETTEDEESPGAEPQRTTPPRIVIEFPTELMRDQCRTEIEEVLRSYEGAEIK